MNHSKVGTAGPGPQSSASPHKHRQCQPQNDNAILFETQTHQPPSVEVPEYFYLVEMHDLTKMIADMLCRLIAHNDHIPLTPNNLTRFHSRAPPGISVSDYLTRVVKYTSLERAALLAILVYIDRACDQRKSFTISSLTVHRFVITAITVACKSICDSYCTNAHYAKVGGISLQELNNLELELVFLMEWQLNCMGNTLQRYYVNLVRQHSQYAVRKDMAGAQAEEGRLIICDAFGEPAGSKEERGTTANDYKAENPPESSAGSSESSPFSSNSTSAASSPHPNALQQPVLAVSSTSSSPVSPSNFMSTSLHAGNHKENQPIRNTQPPGSQVVPVINQFSSTTNVKQITESSDVKE